MASDEARVLLRHLERRLSSARESLESGRLTAGEYEHRCLRDIQECLDQIPLNGHAVVRGT